MRESKYEKYVVRKPIYESGPGFRNRQSPTMTFMSSKQVPEANYYIELGWIYGIFIPKGLLHGPLKWKKVRKPHIEMAIMLGAGTCRENWSDSFLEDPSPGQAD